MIIYKTEEEIELIRESCLLVCKALTLVAEELKPGITGLELDQKAEALIRDHQAIPGFKGYRDFPATLCISKNEEVVHGIPTKEPFKDGDIVSVDCGVYKNEFFGDAAFTFALGDISEEIMQLLVVTKESLYKAIDEVQIGNRIGDISFSVQNHCEKLNGYGVVRELVGHGLGKNLHEQPEVPNFGKRGRGTKLKEGLVIAIEPMINLGRKEVKQSRDGWTIITKDGKPSAHYEHTVAVRNEGVDILSNHTGVEEAIKNNIELRNISLNN